MTRAGWIAMVIAGTIASGLLASACGVKAPPLPPLKESPAPDAGVRPATP